MKLNDLLTSFAPEQLKAIRNDLFCLGKSLSKEDQEILRAIAGCSMLPPSRLLDASRSAMQAARRYPSSCLVEFGVYKGGSLAAISYGASKTASFSGRIVGFDTFEGHIRSPLPNEIDIHGSSQSVIFDHKKQNGEQWAKCDLKSVLENYTMISNRLNANLIQPDLVKGDACETSSSINQYCPNGISLLRLDMDWFEPTKCALDAATPYLHERAIIIIDDYGHHSGAKEAVDLWTESLQVEYDWTMTDYSCKRITLLG